MVTWEQKIDKYGKIYIREALRRAGFENVVQITPNLKTALMHTPDASPRQVVNSLKVLIQHFEQMIDEREEATKK
ncbi:hypothetical protein ES703_00810 [subsurface metagenome]